MPVWLMGSEQGGWRLDKHTGTSLCGTACALARNLNFIPSVRGKYGSLFQGRVISWLTFLKDHPDYRVEENGQWTAGHPWKEDQG